MKHNRISLYAIVALFMLVAVSRISLPDHKIISWDNFGYYLYLPNAFIYDDPGMQDLERVDSLREKYNVSSTLYQVNQTPTGNHIVRYSMGNAVLYAPFFALGHAVAQISGAPADGFSAPYQNALQYGLLLYALVSLVFARKIALRFFNDKISALLLVLLFAGTNLYHILSFENALTHGNLFMVYTLIIWLTIRWHETLRLKYIAGLGICCGLAILTRPTEIVCLLLPLLWNVSGATSAREKLRLLWRQKNQLLVFCLLAGLMVLPQLLYWKKYAGVFIYYSYGNPAEGLDIFAPHTLPFLFSFRKGWFIYTPLMAFAVAGFYVLLKRKPRLFPALFAFFIFNLWLTSSWTCWWYAGSFGSRAMVQSYAVMLIPFGYFLQEMLSCKRKTIACATSIFLLILLILNQFQAWQYNQKILHSDRMTFTYYCKVFGKTNRDVSLEKFLLVDRGDLNARMPDDAATELIKSYTIDFESEAFLPEEKQGQRSHLRSHSGNYAYRLDTGAVFLTLAEVPYNEMTSRDHAWIRISFYLYLESPLEPAGLALVRTFLHKGKNYAYSAYELSKQEPSMDTGGWNLVRVDYLTPELRRRGDHFKAYFWLMGKNPAWIDDITLSLFEQKR